MFVSELECLVSRGWFADAVRPPPLVPVSFVYHQEWERAYLLAKARGMVDGARVINKCPAATQAETPEEAKRKRVEAAPLFLKGRVELDEALPEVDVRREAERRGIGLQLMGGLVMMMRWGKQRPASRRCCVRWWGLW